MSSNWICGQKLIKGVTVKTSESKTNDRFNCFTIKDPKLRIYSFMNFGLVVWSMDHFSPDTKPWYNNTIKIASSRKLWLKFHHKYLILSHYFSQNIIFIQSLPTV